MLLTSLAMIVGYRDRRTERFASGQRVKEFSGFARQAEMRLDRLDAATSLADLAGLPGNRLEALKGDRAGQFSIRINDQWRLLRMARRDAWACPGRDRRLPLREHHRAS